MVLNGGHSGKDIDKNRGNPIIVLGNILAKLNSNKDVFLNFIDGGSWVTAIPRKVECTITTSPLKLESLNVHIQELENHLQTQHNNPNISIKFSLVPTMDIGFDRNVTSKIIRYISKFPNGPILTKKGSSESILSTNLGTIFFDKDTLLLENSIRSNLSPELTQQFTSRLQNVEARIGFDTIETFDFPRIFSEKGLRIYRIPSAEI